jgi:hypothetical protein
MQCKSSQRVTVLHISLSPTAHRLGEEIWSSRDVDVAAEPIATSTWRRGGASELDMVERIKAVGEREREAAVAGGAHAGCPPGQLFEPDVNE